MTNMTWAQHEPYITTLKAPINSTRSGINDSIVHGVHTSTMEFLLGFFTLLCIFAAHISMLGILRIWQQMYFVTLLGTPINNIKNYFVLFHLFSPFRYFLTWMLERQCLLWLKATSAILPWRGRLPKKVICCCFFALFLSFHCRGCKQLCRCAPHDRRRKTGAGTATGTRGNSYTLSNPTPPLA